MSNLIQFPGNHTEQPEARAEHAWERRERLASRSQEAVQNDINRHVAARRAYGEALARVTAIEDGNLPTAQIADAHLKAYEAYTEMTEAARMLLVVMPTDLKALSLLLRGRRRVGNKWQSVSFLSNSGECLGAA